MFYFYNLIKIKCVKSSIILYHYLYFNENGKTYHKIKLSSVFNYVKHLTFLLKIELGFSWYRNFRHKETNRSGLFF